MTLTFLPDPPADPAVAVPTGIACARVAVEIQPGATAADLRLIADALRERAERMERTR